MRSDRLWSIEAMVMVRGGGKELGVLLEAGQTLHYDLHVVEDCVDGVIHEAERRRPAPPAFFRSKIETN